jgi:HK97 family phage major capsid protein
VTIEEILAALQAIIDGAVGEAGEPRDLTEEEAARYEQLEGQLKAVRRSAEIRSRQAAYTMPVNSGLIGSAPKPDNTLERAFSDYLRTGRENQDIVQLRAQSEGTGTEGGYIVPDGFRDKLVDRMKAFGGLANAVETITTSTGNNLSWPTVDDTSNVGEVVAEGGTFVGGADITFGVANLGAYEYAAGGASALPLRVSWALLQDAAFDVEGFVSKKLGERIARLQSPHWVDGNGVQQPLGIVYGLTGTEVSSALSYNDLVDAIHRVDPAYRESGCGWAFNDLSLAAIEKLVDLDGRPLIKDATAGIDGKPSGGSLLGFPITIDQAFDDLTLTSGAAINWGVFGNLNEAYVIRRVKDVTLVVNPYSRASHRQTEFSAWARADGTRQNTNAYTVLAGYTA